MNHPASKKKRWAKAILVALALVLLGYAGVKHYFSDAFLQQYLLSRIQTNLGGSIGYQDFRIRFAGADFIDVVFQPSLNNRAQVAVEAKEILVRYNYVDLVRHLLQPSHRVLRIAILNPVVSLTKSRVTHPRASTVVPDSTRSSVAQSGVPSKRTSSKYGLIESIEISNGKLILKDDPDEAEGLVMMAGVNGWLRSMGEWQAQVRFNGKLQYPNESEVTLTTNLDLRYVALDSINLKLEDFHIKGLLPLPGAGRIEMVEGAISGSLELFREEKDWKHVDLAASLQLMNGRFLFYLDSTQADSDLSISKARGFTSKLMERFSLSRNAPVVIDSVNIKAKLSDKQLTVLSGRQRVNSQPVQFQGYLKLSPLPLKVPSNLLGAPSLQAHLPSISNPEMYFSCESDSLVIQELLRSLWTAEGTNGTSRASASKASHESQASPIQGVMKLRGLLEGSLQAPRFEAELTSTEAVVYGKKMRNFRSTFQYGGEEDATEPDADSKKLRWRGWGTLDLAALDSTKSFGSGHVPTHEGEDQVGWEGWGNIDLSAPKTPLDLTLVADGSLKSVAAEIFEFFSVVDTLSRLQGGPSGLRALRKIFDTRMPQARMTVLGRATGPLLQPQIEGLLNVALQSRRNPVIRWLGQFSLNDDTLEVSTSRRSESFQFGAKIWDWGEKPEFKLRGLDIELLPALFGPEVSKTLLANLELDVYAEGRSDSLNLRLEARKKDSHTAILQLLGHMRPLVHKERITSGYLKLFPELPGAVSVRYTCLWRDSSLAITDLRCENWLSGSFLFSNDHERSVSGNLRISGAELARIFPSKDEAQPPKYRGRLFGELNLSGTMNDPRAAGSLYLFDGSFNEVGNFAMSGRYAIDKSGWLVDSVAVLRNQNPYLGASLRYARSNQRVLFKARGNDLHMGDFLQALANVPQRAFQGAADFDLEATGKLPDFFSEKGLALSGKAAVRDGHAGWFKFDEIDFDLEHAGELKHSAVTRRGIYFHQASYLKKNAFGLTGSAFLPFDLTTEAEISLAGAGNLLATLPDISTFFTEAHSNGQVSLNINGPYQNLGLRNTYVKITNGSLALSMVAPELRDIAGEAVVDARGNLIEIRDLTGRVGDATLSARTVESMPPILITDASDLASQNERLGIFPQWQQLRLGKSRMHLGALLVHSSENGLPLNIPGMMQDGEVGRFQITGAMDSIRGRGDGDEFIIAGPWEHPVFHGRVVLDGVDFQFPFDENSESVDPLVRNILLNIDWNVLTESRRDNRYVISIPTALNDVYVNIGIDDANSWLKFCGIMSDSTLFIEGRGLSTNGVVEYLDMNFRVEEFGAEFDRSDLRPIIYGRASTVITDSTNFPYNVFLTLYTVDPVTREELPRGRFQSAYFRLSTDHPSLLGQTQEQVLARLGYSVDHIKQNATDAVGIGTDNFILRPFIRPVERQLERRLGLDVVRFSSRLTRNLLSSERNGSNGHSAPVTSNSRLAWLRHSRFTFGKYLTRDLYLSYVGQLEMNLVDAAVENPLEGDNTLVDRLTWRHRLGLEYRLTPAMMLKFEYDYNPFLFDPTDQKIWLRHSFPVEFPRLAN